MDKDRERKLLKSIGIDEETMSGDNGNSEAEREFEEIIDKAFKEHRIPIECMEIVETPYYAAKVIKFIEC